MRRVLALTLALTLLPAAYGRAAISPIGADLTIYGSGAGTDSDVSMSASALNPVADDYLLAWTLDPPGSSDRQLLAGIVFADTRSARVFVGRVDTAAGDVRHVASAFDALRQRYLIVWSQEAPTAGAYEIHGRLLEEDGTLIGTPFRISDAGSDPTDPAYDALEPDVAADGLGNFFVVWTQDDDRNGMTNGDFDVFGRRVSSQNGSLLGPPTRLTNFSGGGSGRDALAPVVEWIPDASEYFVIFEGDYDPTPLHAASIYLQPVDASGAPAPFKSVAGGGPIPLSHPEGAGAAKRVVFHAKNPAIAYDFRNDVALVVWDQNGAQQVSTQIGGAIVRPDHTSFGVGALVPTPPSGTSICIARDPSIAYASFADNFLVGWSGTPIPATTCPSDREILAREVHANGVVLGSGPVVMSSTAPAGSLREAVVPEVMASGAPHHGALVMWSGEPFTSDSFELMGQFLGLDRGTDAPPAETVRELALRAAPNPFNPRTTVSFDLPRSGRATVRVYDLRGALVRELVDAEFEAGRHRVSWEGLDAQGRRVASGTYFLRLSQQDETRTVKTVLVK